MEPLSVAVHALVNIGKVRANQTVAVFGAGMYRISLITIRIIVELSPGPVGLLLLAVAKSFGAKRVISIDIVQSRLDFAKKYAATDIYLPLKKAQDETNIAYSRRNAAEMKTKLGIDDRGDKGVDIVVDASGAEVSIQTSIYLAKEGGWLLANLHRFLSELSLAGTFLQVGMGNAEVTIPM